MHQANCESKGPSHRISNAGSLKLKKTDLGHTASLPLTHLQEGMRSSEDLS